MAYTADSPFFSSKLDHFASDMDQFSDFLKIMVRQMRQFCKDVKQSAKSAEALGLHMRNGLRSSSSHTQLLPVIARLGEIMSEIAASQDILVVSLERSFTQPLERFYTVDIAGMMTTKNQYVSLKESGESATIRYLQSDMANFGRGLAQHQLEQRAYDIAQHKRRFEVIRYDLVQKMNELEARKSFELAESCVSGVYALRTHHHLCMDRLQSCQVFLSDLQKRQQEERSAYEERQQLIERRRQDLSTVLDAMVERVEIACPHLVAPNIEPTLTPPPPSSAPPDTRPSPSLPLDDAAALSAVAAASWQNLSRMSVTWGASLIGNLTRPAPAPPPPNTAPNNSSKPSLASSNPSSTSGPIVDQPIGVSPRMNTDSPSPLALSSAPAYGAPVSSTSCEECETRMKALDSSELIALYSSVGVEGYLTDPSIVKQVSPMYIIIYKLIYLLLSIIIFMFVMCVVP
jgi:hypothetical protein